MVRKRCILYGALSSIFIFSCGPSGGGRAGGGTPASAQQTAAESLTNALEFNNSEAKKVSGAFPGSLAGAVSGGQVNVDDDGGVGQINFDSSVDGEEVVATLVYMEGANSYWTLPASGALRRDDSVMNSFSFSPGLCADLCNIIHQVKCYEAAQTASGTITTANLTEVILNCSEGGSSTNCGSSSAVPSPTGDCQSVCANLQNQCDASYFNNDCLSDCQKSGASSSFLSCCASATFPAGKCQDEGIGEVGFEDCDDDGICVDDG